MKIQSGATGERRTRILIVLVMCVAMSAWFAYDGIVGYPAKNLEWAKQRLPETSGDLQTNFLASAKRLERVTRGTTVDQLEELLGEPTLVQPKHLRFVGEKLIALVHLDDEDKVLAVTKEEGSPDEKPSKRVTPALVERITEGMSLAEVKAELREPAALQEKIWWYVGPAAYGGFQIVDGSVVGKPDVQISRDPSETDILVQKILVAILAVLATGIAVRLYRVVRTHVVLDDTGLTVNGRHVAWDAMTGLVTDRYNEKGWVDLDYSDNESARRLRLDSYHIARFDEIVDALCERKGFVSPTSPADRDDKPDESVAGPTADHAPDEPR